MLHPHRLIVTVVAAFSCSVGADVSGDIQPRRGVAKSSPAPPGAHPQGPCEDIEPPTPDYFEMQTYHGPDPGLNMTAAWAMGSARGAGVKLAFCEWAYYLDHEDLCEIALEAGQTMLVLPEMDPDHATAGLGVVLSADNGYGCTGLVPEAAGHFFPLVSVEEGSRFLNALRNAFAAMDLGDVVVLNFSPAEPIEVDLVFWTLIKSATDAGVVVVESAGTANLDLDSPRYQEWLDRGDSGAIIVGGGTADVNHDKHRWSNFGSRVDLQGWYSGRILDHLPGFAAFTLGYGDFAQHGGDINQSYTDDFPFPAVPFIAGCAVALQSLADEHLGRRLTPLEVRDILVSTGIPQGSGGHIGPFPDMAAAAAQITGPPGDLDGDGEVGIADLLILLAAWGVCPDPPDECPADLDGDGAVGIVDLLLLLANWG